MNPGGGSDVWTVQPGNVDSKAWNSAPGALARMATSQSIAGFVKSARGPDGGKRCSVVPGPDVAHVEQQRGAALAVASPQVAVRERLEEGARRAAKLAPASGGI